MSRHLVVVLGFLIAACGDEHDFGERPETVIDMAPAAVSSERHVTVLFHATGAAGFACSLDGGVAMACASPWVFDAGDGAHELAISAIGATRELGEPATASFSVDTVRPGVTITSGPSGLLASGLSTWTFVVTDAPTSVTCMIDHGAPQPCSDSFTTTLPDGVHSFFVAVADAAGNQGNDIRMVAIDTTGPTVVLGAPLIAGRTSFAQPVLTFTLADQSLATATCAVDIGAAVACSATFASPTPLAQGAHAYHVHASDQLGNTSTTDVAFNVDLVPPTVAITATPTDPTNDATPTFEFTTSIDTTRARCTTDSGAVVDPCVSPVTLPALPVGTRTFTVTAFDNATPPNTASAAYSFVLGACGDHTGQGSEDCDGPDLRGKTCVALGFGSGTLACSASCTFDTSACSGCGNGTLETGEQCDGAALNGASCTSLGYASGALGCTSSCTYDPSLCFEPAGTNAATVGTVCYDGVKYGQSFYATCSEDTGVWRYIAGQTPDTWLNQDGLVTGQSVVNLHGRAVIAPLDVPAAVFLVDNSNGANSYRSNLFGSTVQPIAWPTASQISFASGGMPIEMYSGKAGSSVNNTLGGWHPTLGAVVIHGGPNLTATVSAVGAGVTGIVSAITTGAFSLPSTDINVAVYGKTPAGDDATGGIYWSCDVVGTAGGTFVEHDTGLAATDKPLVWTLVADPSTYSTANARTCPTTSATVTGYATTYYAGLRGGGQVYKTLDGGATWTQHNSGLPAGAEVYTLAIDCERVVSGFPQLCHDPNTLYAATSKGLYVTTDAAATWTLAGFENVSVRGVALQIDRAVGVPVRAIAGVDDATRMYRTVVAP